MSSQQVMDTLVDIVR